MNKNFKQLFLDISEQEYRDLKTISYSRLSSFAKGGGVDLIKQRKVSDAMIFGTLVETLLFDEDMTEKFVVLEEKPTATLLTLSNDLIGMEVFPTKDNALDVVKMAIEGKYWKSIKDPEKINNKITDVFYNYIYVMRENLLNNKYIINKELLLRAQHKVEVLRNHKFTSHLFSYDNLDKYLFQLKGLVDINDTPVKFMIDMLYVDEENKTIQPYDFKTGREYAEKFEANFYAFKYYIQGGLYSEGLRLLIKDTIFEDYEVLPFKFVYINSGNQDAPIIKVMEKGWDELAKNGWENSFGYKSMGYLELIDEVMWHIVNEEYNYSKETVENNGESSIKLPV